MLENRSFSSLTNHAVEAAIQAGSLLRKGFGTTFEISTKAGIQNFVTEYDHASEKCIISFLEELYPSHAFLCEESGAYGASSLEKAEILWIIDPLDGTSNFIHNIPLFCISIGALGPQGIVTGVIYQPMSDELFVAEKNKGAFLNGKKMEVSKTLQFAGGIGATSFPHNISENPLGCIDHFVKILKKETIIRNLGSSAINAAYVAAGRFDAYWTISLCPWDIAAANLMIEEAGGKVTTYEGTPYPVLSGSPVVASNGFVHDELLSYLKNIAD